MIEWLYYIAFITLFVGVLLSNKIDKKILVPITLIPVVFIILFRFGQGIDYFSYEFIYDNQLTGTFGEMLDHQERYELGFRVLIFIFKNLNLSAHIFIVSLSLITFLTLTVWIYKNSENPALSNFIFYGMFFLVWVLSALRQGVVLGIGTLLFFSKKRYLKLPYEIIVIVLLSTLHYSALIYLVLIIFREVKISTKYFAILLVISILFTFVPIVTILENLTFIPGVSKIISGAQNSPGIFDFASLVRIVFSAYLLFLLYYYDWDKYNKMLIQLSLLGFSMYFFLKINEVLAGRIGIYTFIFMVLIFASNYQKILTIPFKYLYLIGLVLFSGLYFYKDTQSYQSLVGKINTSQYLKFESITNVTTEDYWGYNNQYSYNLYYRKMFETQKDTFMENHSLEYDNYSKDKGNIVVYSPLTKQYGIMNEEGYWLTDQNYGYKPILRGSIIQEKMEGGLESFKYNDRFNLGIKEQDYQKIVDEAILKDQRNAESLALSEDITIEDLPESVLSLFPSTLDIESVHKINLTSPFSYSIYQVKYFNYYLFIYTTSEGELIGNQPYREINRFDSEGLLRNHGFIGTEIINKKGEVIWYE